MKKILKHRWGFVAGIMLAIVFGSVLGAPQTAYADYGDDVSKCKYTMSIDKQEIKRTDCGDKANLVFTNADGPADGVGKFVQTSNEKSCKQTIETDGSGSATLDGEYEGEVTTTQPGTYEQVTSIYCLGFDKVTISVATGTNGSTTTNANAVAARIALINNRLEALVDEVCKNDSSGRCAVNYQNAIGVCTTKAYGVANSATGNRNNKFRDALLNCLSKETDKGLNARENRVRQALSGQIMNDIEKAAEKAAQQANLGTANEGDPEEDTCNMSGNPMSWVLCPIYDGLGGVSDWLLENFIEPFLFTDPVSTDPDDELYQIWSTFRIWGNVFLVIALLVIVFGQAIGGGIVDAYTAKKVLPRVLVAAILINLSIYIVALAVDITNVLGRGIANIMTAPLDGVSMSPGGTFLGITGAAITFLGVGSVGFLAVTGTLLGALGVAASALGAAIPFILLFIILPAFLAIVFVFCILVFRTAVITALILISPVAFALYCLPNTEQYFKKWWSLLFNMLMLYPIIMIIFATANILAYTTIASTQDGGANSGFGQTANGWGYLVAFLLQFLPLFLIPYAFRLAGGILGRINDIASGLGKRGVEAVKGDARDPFSMRNKAKRRFFTNATRSQQAMVDARRNGGTGKARHRLGQRVVGRVAGMAGHVDSRSARYNAEAQERRKQIADTWNDDLIYAGAGFKKDVNGKTQYYSAKYDANEINPETGQRGYNQQIRKELFDDGQRSYGSNNHEVNDSLSYALGKAQTDGQNAAMRRSVAMNAKDRKWTDGELKGAWAQITYPHKVTQASEWYSTPSIDNSGNVSFADISNDDKSYRKFTDDLHKSRESFRLGSVRDVDWRAMQERMHGANGYVTKLKAGQTLSLTEAEDFVRTNEILEAATQRLQQRDPTADGEVSSNGASAASQKIIESMASERQGWGTRVTAGNVDAREITYTAPMGPAGPNGQAGPRVTNPIMGGIVVTGDSQRSQIPRSY